MSDDLFLLLFFGRLPATDLEADQLMAIYTAGKAHGTYMSGPPAGTVSPEDEAERQILGRYPACWYGWGEDNDTHDEWAEDTQ